MRRTGDNRLIYCTTRHTSRQSAFLARCHTVHAHKCGILSALCFSRPARTHLVEVDALRLQDGLRRRTSVARPSAERLHVLWIRAALAVLGPKLAKLVRVVALVSNPWSKCLSRKRRRRIRLARLVELLDPKRSLRGLWQFALTRCGRKSPMDTTCCRCSPRRLLLSYLNFDLRNLRYTRWRQRFTDWIGARFRS